MTDLVLNKSFIFIPSEYCEDIEPSSAEQPPLNVCFEETEPPSAEQPELVCKTQVPLNTNKDMLVDGNENQCLFVTM